MRPTKLSPKIANATQGALDEALSTTSLSGQSFELLAQPIIDLERNAISHYELLLRLRTPGGKQLPPAGFDRIVHGLGLEHDLDLWVAERAVTLMRGGDAGPQFEINVSVGSALDEDFSEAIGAMIAREQLSPEALIVEIAGTYPVDHANMRHFSDRRFRVATHFNLHDFERSGFGILERLPELPFDLIKIDIEFIRELDTSSADQAIVRRASQLIKAAGRRSVAIGVERPEIVPWLREAGVDYGQGYLYGAPAPLESR